MATVSECRTAIKNTIEQKYPVFVSEFNKAVEELANGAFTAEIDLNFVARESSRAGAREEMSINKAVWYILSMGFYCEGSISKRLEVAVEPIYVGP